MRFASPALLLSITVLASGATSASAHCCHDERVVGPLVQSEFRRGTHGLDDGITDDSIQAEPPTTGRGLGEGSSVFQGGGLGSMHGNSLGAYGAGSVGQPGPGGIGTLHGNYIGGQPPRPR